MTENENKEIQKMKKIIELKEYLIEEENAGLEELEDIKEVYDNTFDTPYGEYMVLTDEEADEHAEEYIESSVWAFNPDFIIGQSSALDYDEASKIIIEAIGARCENGNEAMKKLIDSMDDFIREAICADGRGYYMSSYDGEEYQGENFFIYRMN